MALTDLIGPCIGAGIALLIAMVGWIWHLSNKTAQVEYIDRRLTALEKAFGERNTKIEEIASGLARIEPMIALAVEHFKMNIRLGSTAD